MSRNLYDERTEVDMSQTLTISDTLYARLEAKARERGLSNIEQLLEEWERNESGILRRQEVVRQIDSLRKRLFDKYGKMPDSVELIR
jgi:hypothetical protein